MTKFSTYIIIFLMKRKVPDEKKNEVIKHSSSIQISNKITLFQRKAWNVMLAHAFNDLENYEIKNSKSLSPRFIPIWVTNIPIKLRANGLRTF